MAIKFRHDDINIFKTLKYVEIETCNLCTRKCEWCLFGQVENCRGDKLQYLENKYIEKILNELVEIDFDGTLSLYSINEPLLDPRIVSGELIKLCRLLLDKKVDIVLITNGDLLNKSISNKLFDSGLSRLSISCYDDKSYVKANELLKEIDNKYVNKLYILDQRRYLTGNWESNRAGLLKYKNNENKYLDMPCFMPYFRTVIGWNGKIRVCPHDTIGANDFGNIKEKSLMKIFSDEIFDNFMRKLSKSRYNCLPCKECNIDGSLEYSLKHLNRVSEVMKVTKYLEKI